MQRKVKPRIYPKKEIICGTASKKGRGDTHVQHRTSKNAG